jgi:hypothetical protein
MTHNTAWHPDLLRRFVPTPYVFSKCDGRSRIRVESNDLEIALSVRDSCIIQGLGSQTGGLLCKIIRDAPNLADSSEISIVSDGPLRILHLGRGAILIHDHERSELLGFVPANIRMKELISSLIPALTNLKREESVELVAFTKK